MTPDKTPTDDELKAMLPTKQLARDEAPKVQVWLTQSDALVFARAVLAKQGSPVVEPGLLRAAVIELRDAPDLRAMQKATAKLYAALDTTPQPPPRRRPGRCRLRRSYQRSVSAFSTTALRTSVNAWPWRIGTASCNTSSQPTASKKEASMASRRLRERGDKHDPYRWEAQPWQSERDDDDKPPPEPDSEPVPVNTTH